VSVLIVKRIGNLYLHREINEPGRGGISPAMGVAHRGSSDGLTAIVNERP